MKLKKHQKIQSTFIEYILDSEIGCGGNAHVWEVHNVSDKQRKFAMKILSPEACSNGDKYNRFCNEVAFSLFNSHQNLIPVHDTGIIPDIDFKGEKVQLPFAVMPRAKCSLRDIIKGKFNYPPYIKFKLVKDIINGLVFLHNHEVIHRDLKPENILVFDNNEISAAISDLGIAHFYEYPAVENKTGENTRMGNRDYASPEQREKPYNTFCSSDIYSLGLIVHELFTGELLLGTPSKKIQEISPKYYFLDEIVLRSVCADYTARYANAIKLKEEFDRLENNISIFISNRRDQSVHFWYDRFQQAFPIAGGKFDTADSVVIINKLSLLLRPPYILNNHQCVVMLNKKYRPDIRNFKIIDEKTVLIGDFECQISKLHAFSDGLDYHPYVYIEVNSLESLNSEKTNKSASFDDEEYVVYDNRIVSIGEREAGVIENSDGTTIKVEQKDFETRIRPLKKTNWIILSPTHPANNSPYETQITRLMEDILSGEKTLKDLDSFVTRLPKPDFYEF